MKIKEKVLEVKLHKVCKNHHHHWIMLVQGELFQKDNFCPNLKKAHFDLFWQFSPPNFCKCSTMTWTSTCETSLFFNILWTISMNYEHGMFFKLSLHLSTPPKKCVFFNFFQCSSQMHPMKTTLNLNLKQHFDAKRQSWIS